MTSRRGSIRRQALVDRLRDEAATAETAIRALDHELAAALAALASIDAEIIRLVHWDGFTLAEVARHLGRPAATVRSCYSRARVTLRAALDFAVLADERF